MIGAIAGRRLYLCTADRPDLAEFVAACIRGGVDIVQLRDKELADGAILDRARILRTICGDLGVPFILNDRPDLAAASGADGVHVGQDDPAPAAARRLLGPGAFVGRSTHSQEDLERALGEPVDYISAGPVVATPTKPGRRPTGTGYLSTAVARSTVPVFVTGGVSPATVPALAAAGARHFVVVRFLTQSTDPEGAARSLRTVIDRSVELPPSTVP